MTEGNETTGRDWAAPERAVLAAGRDALARGDDAVLVTVVAVDGRAYRRPGAKAVIDPAGETGGVTAGCLTDELRSLAADVLASGDPRLERFDLRADGDEWGLGVGCNGVVEVLLEPLGERHRPLFAAAGVRAPGGSDRTPEGTTAAVVVASEDDRLAAGDRAYDEFEAWPAAVAGAVSGDADPPRTVAVETDRGTVRAFVERVRPGPHLLVVGSGADARPVVGLARDADFRVTVAGFRGALATPARFPRADRVVATSPRDLTDVVHVDGDTYAVVMTHNLVDDRLAVERLLATDAPYVGVLGPAERFERLVDAMERDITTGDRDRVYAPVGLDLGGGTPHQVATSVVAEVLAAVNGREGGHLRDAGGPIHEREDGG